MSAPDVDVLEKEMISTRTLALTRFQRNHEFMDEVFMQAALGLSTSLTHLSELTFCITQVINTRRKGNHLGLFSMPQS